jgi:hypothetical protein
MKQEILNAIKLAKEIAEKKGKLVVGTGISRVPKDFEGNPTAAPIMIHFDAERNIVFFRASDEDGDPLEFEFPLEVAEALGLALNDLLGLFDTVEFEKLAFFETELATTVDAANIYQLRLEALISEREALIAENSYCDYFGEIPAYGEKKFVENAKAIRELETQFLNEMKNESM